MHRPLLRGTIGASLWPMHPSVLTDRMMAEVGASARRGEGLSPATAEKVQAVAKRSPLAVEPFLIHGAVAQSEGNEERAERLFEEARTRDPRSEVARYFLADHYLRSGRISEALTEMAVFSRLVPTSGEQFAPALASFALTPGVVPQLRRFFRASPELEPPVLSHLAKDARNANLIVALASSGRGSHVWQSAIVGALVEQGQHAKALAVWRKISGVNHSGKAIFNPQFEKIDKPPPFNWAFAAKGGLAEPTGEGGLKVIYYGREDVVIAQQLLLLEPGRHQLAMQVTGQPGDGSGIAWTVTCLPKKQVILSLPLKQGERVAAGPFIVPQNCPAQRLELTGSIVEFPQSIDFAINQLRVAKVATR